MKLSRYTENLRIEGNKVFSYSTHVADIDHDSSEVKALGWWSVSTQKHINYVASQYGYKSIKSK